MLPDGKKVPHLGEIPHLDLPTWDRASTASLEGIRTEFLPRIRSAMGNLELKAVSVDQDTDGLSRVLSLDVALSVDQTGDDLDRAMGQVWAEVRLLNSDEPTIGLGYMRAFDSSGRQVVSEVYDFMLNGGMVRSDIRYPSG